MRAFAEEKEITCLPTWATFRDRQCDGDTASASECSGVEQQDGAFAQALSG